jgi:hypothetical protein
VWSQHTLCRGQCLGGLLRIVKRRARRLQPHCADRLFARLANHTPTSRLGTPCGSTRRHEASGSDRSSLTPTESPRNPDAVERLSQTQLETSIRNRFELPVLQAFGEETQQLRVRMQCNFSQHMQGVDPSHCSMSVIKYTSGERDAILGNR